MTPLNINWPDLPSLDDAPAEPSPADLRHAVRVAEIAARVAYGRLPVWRRCITPKPVGWHVQGTWHQ